MHDFRDSIPDSGVEGLGFSQDSTVREQMMVGSRASLCRWSAREGMVCSRLCAIIDILESYSKMTFPVENIVRILATSSGEATTTARSKNWVSELGVRYLRLSTYLVVSYLAYAYTWPIHEAHEWKWGWILGMIL